MDGTRDYHTKWSKSEKKRQIPYNITYMWNLKYNTNELMYETKTHRHREQTCGCQGGGRVEGGVEWKFRVSRCKLLYTEWINNEVLLYNTGNYIQYPVINYNGKE